MYVGMYIKIFLENIISNKYIIHLLICCIRQITFAQVHTVCVCCFYFLIYSVLFMYIKIVHFITLKINILFPLERILCKKKVITFNIVHILYVAYIKFRISFIRFFKNCVRQLLIIFQWFNIASLSGTHLYTHMVAFNALL